MLKTLQGIIKWLYPAKCVICLELLPISESSGFCKKCENLFTYITEPYCELCGRPLVDDICSCSKQPINFIINRSLFYYDDVMSNVIYAFKYGGHQAHARILGRLMSENFNKYFSDIDIILPVPMYYKKERFRGFNQSTLLAREIASYVGINFSDKALLRIKDTVPQSELSAKDRRVNLVEAFKVPQSDILEGKRVLIVDDIFTTGSTLSECALAALNAGALEVYGYTLSAAIIHRNSK